MRRIRAMAAAPHTIVAEMVSVRRVSIRGNSAPLTSTSKSVQGVDSKDD